MGGVVPEDSSQVEEQRRGDVPAVLSTMASKEVDYLCGERTTSSALCEEEDDDGVEAQRAQLNEKTVEKQAQKQMKRPAAKSSVGNPPTKTAKVKAATAEPCLDSGDIPGAALARAEASAANDDGEVDSRGLRHIRRPPFEEQGGPGAWRDFACVKVLLFASYMF